MLTHEKVLEVFKDYLAADDDFEVVLTSRGYTVLAWDDRALEWYNVQLCPTPEELLDALLGGVETYIQYEITKGRRDLTEQEEQEMREKMQALFDKCK